jgi:hypothetical protein
VIHWISRVSGVLISVSNAPACDRHTQDELRKHALWLISILSFVPDDIDTVKFIENFQMTETLFEAAMDAHRGDCPDMVADIADLLVLWMLKGGRFHSGRAILEHSIYGLAVLAFLAEADGAIPKLKVKVSKHLAPGRM